MSDSESKDKSVGWTEALGEAASTPLVPRTSGDTILALGREWKVSSIEKRVKAQFEQWVRLGARRAIQEADEEVGTEEAAAMRSTYQADWGAGFYTWTGRHCRRALADIPGIRHLMYLLIKRCHPEVTEELVSQMSDDNPREFGDAFRRSLGNLQALEASQIRKMTATNQGETNGNGKRKMEETEPVTMDG